MTKPTAIFLAVLAAASGVAAAQSRLAEPSQRISDEAIHRELSIFEHAQQRIRIANDGGRPLGDYHLAKAQCWLDVAFHEYTRNDRSDFPQLGLGESGALLDAMEQGVDPLPSDTPLINGAARLREDLWARLAAVRAAPGAACAQAAIACGEVELVHAGNEFNQQQWRHAKPYIQIAEDRVLQAELQAAECVSPAAPMPDAVAATPAPATLDVLFEFDRWQRGDIRGASLQSLEAVLAEIRSRGDRVVGVELTGHADRLDGNAGDYNVRLSRRRAETVGALLAEHGIAPTQVVYRHAGDSQQVVSCEGVAPGEALRECLLPNRRVEVRITTESEVD